MNCDKLHTPPTGIPDTTQDNKVVLAHTAEPWANNPRGYNIPEREETHMLHKVVVLDTKPDEAMTWSRSIQLAFLGAVVHAELAWEGEPYGYQLYIDHIETYEETGKDDSILANRIEDELMSLKQDDLYELDGLTQKAQEILS